MGVIAATLTTWEEFLVLPDAEGGHHLELHDGEVVLVPRAARAKHVYVQSLLTKWLTDAAKGLGWADKEFPYRPAASLQFWCADVAYLPNQDWEGMKGNDYPVYAPPLVVEVLSPSNRPAKIQRQRVAAFSAGTREFWVIDPERQTIEVSAPGLATRVFEPGESISISVLAGAVLPVSFLFPQ